MQWLKDSKRECSSRSNSQYFAKHLNRYSLGLVCKLDDSSIEGTKGRRLTQVTMADTYTVLFCVIGVSFAIAGAVCAVLLVCRRRAAAASSRDVLPTSFSSTFPENRLKSSPIYKKPIQPLLLKNNDCVKFPVWRISAFSVVHQVALLCTTR
jgi:hypothetical protein